MPGVIAHALGLARAGRSPLDRSPPWCRGRSSIRKGNRSRGRRSGSRRSCATMSTSRTWAGRDGRRGPVHGRRPGRRGDRPRFLSLWAHAPGSRVAIASLSSRPKDDRGPIRLTLGPPAKTPVRVRGGDGKPVAGATVRLSPRLPRRPAGQARGHDRRAGARAIEGVNPGQVYRVDVTADGLGTQGHNVTQQYGGGVVAG